MTKKRQLIASDSLRGRVLARVLADDLALLGSAGVHCKPCGSGGFGDDIIVNDPTWALADSQAQDT